MPSTTLDQSFSCTTPNAPEWHRLISHFFTDYLRLVEPDSAAQMHLEDCRILPAPGEGNANVVHARVPSHRAEEVTILAAIEPVAQEPRCLAAKLGQLVVDAELADRLPVLLSVVYLSEGRPGVHLETATLSEVGGIECVRLYFNTWCISRSRAEYYLARPEPLAWAIAPFMRSDSHSQSALFEAARARILQARLSDDACAALLRFLAPDLHHEAYDEAKR